VNHDQKLNEIDIETVLEPQNNNTSKPNDEIPFLNNIFILVDLSTFHLSNNTTNTIYNKLAVVQNNLFYKTEKSFQPESNISKTNIKFKMASNHNFSPGIFNGTQDECVLKFLKILN